MLCSILVKWGVIREGEGGAGLLASPFLAAPVLSTPVSHQAFVTDDTVPFPAI